MNSNKVSTSLETETETTTENTPTCDVDFHYNTKCTVDYLDNTYEIEKQDYLYKKQLLEVFYLEESCILKHGICVGEHIDNLYDDIMGQPSSSSSSSSSSLLKSDEYKTNMKMLDTIMLMSAEYILCDDKRVGFTLLFSFDFFQYFHVFLVQYIDSIRSLIHDEGEMDDTKRNALLVQQNILKVLEYRVKNKGKSSEV